MYICMPIGMPGGSPTGMGGAAPTLPGKGAEYPEAALVLDALVPVDTAPALGAGTDPIAAGLPAAVANTSTAAAASRADVCMLLVGAAEPPAAPAELAGGSAYRYEAACPGGPASYAVPLAAAACRAVGPSPALDGNCCMGCD